MLLVVFENELPYVVHPEDSVPYTLSSLVHKHHQQQQYNTGWDFILQSQTPHEHIEHCCAELGLWNRS